MSSKAYMIKTRYGKGFVTDNQLSRYLELGAITQEEYDEIYVTRHVEVAEESEKQQG